MDIEINEVQEIIKNLESGGELSIKEEKYLKVAKLFAQLAAENVALKEAFSPEEIPDEAVDAFSDTVAIDSDWDESGTWSYVENETEVIRAVLDALKPDTPATDRIVAGIKADAIDEAAVELDRVDTVASTRVIGFKLREFSQQLREGADK